MDRIERDRAKAAKKAKRNEARAEKSARSKGDTPDDAATPDTSDDAAEPSEDAGIPRPRKARRLILPR
jgi:hypothetical protein